MAGEKATKAGKIKKKKWIKVVAPKLFQNELIGEIPVAENKALIGRKVTVNLMTLTNDMKRQNTNISFLISSIKGDTAFTDFFGYYLNPSSIKRLIRRGKEKINSSIICRTADKKIIRIKPLIIPFSSVQSSVATTFRKQSTDYLGSYAAKSTFENIIRDLVANKLQRDMKVALKKIHPIRILEISKMHIETEKKASEEKIVKVQVPEETAKEVPEETTEDEPQKKEKRAKAKEAQEKEENSDASTEDVKETEDVESEETDEESEEVKTPE